MLYSINRIANLYNCSEGLSGCAYTDPLKKYNNLFDNSNLIIRVAKYAVAIFVYPLLGSYALYGMYLNDTQLRKDGDNVKRLFKNDIDLMKMALGSTGISGRDFLEWKVKPTIITIQCRLNDNSIDIHENLSYKIDNLIRQGVFFDCKYTVTKEVTIITIKFPENLSYRDDLTFDLVKG